MPRDIADGTARKVWAALQNSKQQRAVACDDSGSIPPGWVTEWDVVDGTTGLLHLTALVVATPPWY
jgi:hypothetical protein